MTVSLAAKVWTAVVFSAMDFSEVAEPAPPEGPEISGFVVSEVELFEAGSFKYVFRLATILFPSADPDSVCPTYQKPGLPPASACACVS